MLDVKLIPHTKIDGIRTYKDSEIMGLYDRMVKEGSADITFSDGCVQSREGFLKMAKNSGFFVVSCDGEIVGVTWITDIYGKRGEVHFCAFKTSIDWAKNGVECGKTVASKLINLKDKNGHIFDVLLGITPKDNLPACIWLARIGLEKLCEIPYGIYSAKEKRSVPAVFWCLTRG